MSLSPLENKHVDNVPLDTIEPPSPRLGPFVQKKMSELGLTNDAKRSTSTEKTPLVVDNADNVGNPLFVGYIQPCLGEMLGVAVFVFLGTGSAAFLTDLLPIAMAWGLALAVVVAGIGAVSGGHVNPAVTLGVWMAGAIAPGLAVCYVIAQLIGSIIGAALCRGIMSYTVEVIQNESVTQYETVSGGVSALGDGVSLGNGILCEIVLTFVLVITVLMTAVDANGRTPVAPIAIGLSVLVGILAGGMVSGGSMNPARSFGPAVVMSSIDTSVWDDHWVYWVGPLAGALVAGIIYRLILGDNEKRLVGKN